MRVSRPYRAYACVKVWVPKMDEMCPNRVQQISELGLILVKKMSPKLKN